MPTGNVSIRTIRYVAVNRAIGRLIRADLIVIDLCRRRDYAEMRRGAIVKACCGRAS